MFIQNLPIFIKLLVPDISSDVKLFSKVFYVPQYAIMKVIYVNILFS